MQRSYVNPNLKRRTLIALAGLMLIGSVAGATALGSSDWSFGAGSPQTELSFSGTNIAPLTAAPDAANQNLRQNPVVASAAAVGFGAAPEVDAANQNLRQNPVVTSAAAVGFGAAPEVDAANQNLRQNPVVTSGAAVGVSEVDAANQNPRQNSDTTSE